MRVLEPFTSWAEPPTRAAYSVATARLIGFERPSSTLSSSDMSSGTRDEATDDDAG
jgi:hypothetical protein